MTTTPYITRAMLQEHLTVPEAVAALRDALHDGIGAEDRASHASETPLRHGTLRVTHAEGLGYAGTQLTGTTPGEACQPGCGSGTYVLMDDETLIPLAILDGAALAEVRASAVAALAADLLAPRDASRLVVAGAGPLARAVVDAVRHVRPIAHVVIAGAPSASAKGIAAFAAEAGMEARLSEDTPLDVAIPQADVIIITDPAEGVSFDGGLVRAGACVITLGTPGGPGAGLDPELLARCSLIVDDVASAGQIGDVRAALESGALNADAITSLERFALGELAASRELPNVFASIGAPWQDLAMAVLARRAVPSQRRKYVPGTAAQARRYD